jgi:uncharacterized membrane protein YhaH (DUF805 family)
MGMLGFLFGFNARIGRLHYLLSLFGLGFVIAVMFYVVTGTALSSTNGYARLLSFSSSRGIIALGVVFMAVGFTLQSMRFRDIGWDPVCVVPGWIAAMMIDRLIAVKLPAVSLGPNTNQTAVGALIHIGLVLVLLFWPGAKSDATEFDEPRGYDAPPRRDAAGAAAQRMARISGGR